MADTEEASPAAPAPAPEPAPAAAVPELVVEDAADAGGADAGDAKPEAGASPYETYKKSAAGRTRTAAAARKPHYPEVDTSNLSKAADILRRLNERRDDRT